MIDKADELPLAEMDDTLGHVLSHMDDCDLLVIWSDGLVGQKRVIDHP